jgi:hypothetical protein
MSEQFQPMPLGRVRERFSHPYWLFEIIHRFLHLRGLLLRRPPRIDPAEDGR